MFSRVHSHHHIVGFKPVTLTPSCLSHTLPLHHDYESLTLCFSSEPKLHDINNSRAAVKHSFPNAVNISQEENIFAVSPSWINSHISAGCLIIHPNRGRSTVHSRLMLLSGSNLCRIRSARMLNSIVTPCVKALYILSL